MESYERIGWQDHVVDIITEEVIQEGTPVSQTNMNHMLYNLDLNSVNKKKKITVLSTDMSQEGPV